MKDSTDDVSRVFVGEPSDLPLQCAASHARAQRWASLLAHDAVIVAVVHVAIRWMTTSHRRNAVPARFRTGDPTVAVVIVLLQRSRAAGSWGLTCLGTLSAATSAAGLTHDAIAIAVSHVGIGGMVTMHRGNAVRAGFRAGDPTVAVVVPLCDLSR